MLRTLVVLVAVLLFGAGCMSREARRDVPWEQGGYADSDAGASRH